MGMHVAEASETASTPRTPPAGVPAPQPSAARLTLLIASCAAIIAAFAAYIGTALRATRMHEGRFDFSQVYAAARALSLDPHANIYSPAVITASEVAGRVLAPPSLPYPYPPLLAILLAPLARLPFPTAANVFLYLNLVLWPLCTLIVAVEVRHILGDTLRLPGASTTRGIWSRLVADPAPIVALAISASIFFISRPAQWTIGNGQVNYLVLLPLVAVPWLTRRGHERAVGVAVALAAMIKLTPIVLLGYLALRGRWKAFTSAITTLALLTLGCVAVVGPQVILTYPTALLGINAGAAAEAHNESLTGPLSGLLVTAAPSATPIIHLATYAVLAALAGTLAVLLWRAPHGKAAQGADARQDSDSLGYAIALCGIVLLSPTAWAHHYVWLLPAAAIVTAHALAALLSARGAPAATRRPLLVFSVAVLATVLLNLPLPYGWDTDPALRHTLLFGLPLRPWLEELRPLGGLLVIAVAAALLRSARAKRADGGYNDANRANGQALSPAG